jgi:hypothetical protein
MEEVATPLPHNAGPAPLPTKKGEPIPLGEFNERHLDNFNEPFVVKDVSEPRPIRWCLERDNATDQTCTVDVSSIHGIATRTMTWDQFLSNIPRGDVMQVRVRIHSSL